MLHQICRVNIGTNNWLEQLWIDKHSGWTVELNRFFLTGTLRWQGMFAGKTTDWSMTGPDVHAGKDSLVTVPGLHEQATEGATA